MINVNSPVFVDAILYTMYGLLALATLLTVWSMGRSMSRMRRTGGRSNGIPVRLIALLTILLTGVALVVTYLTAGTQPLMINGLAYTDRFWLRMSDMLINTSLLLISVAAGCTLLGLMGIGRKLK